MKPTRDPHETSALFAGIAAFVTWGLVPVYWKLLRFIPATEILAHRFVWTCVFMILLLSWQRRWPEVLANLRSYRTALFCAGSGIAIAINWFVFIWAVNAGRVLETSLGYFMSPLVNVLLGAIFLRERLSRAQLVSVLLASGAVCYLTFGFGRLPCSRDGCLVRLDSQVWRARPSDLQHSMFSSPPPAAGPPRFCSAECVTAKPM